MHVNCAMTRNHTSVAGLNFFFIPMSSNKFGKDLSQI